MNFLLDLKEAVTAPLRRRRSLCALGQHGTDHVVVRPDQYVAHVLPLDAHRDLAAFFAGFLVTG